ncbi:MAG: hypothetical protein K2Z80_36160 [Xanthobacteraceae bacterium]|nr:hypothetical protein [Xanthobacteraceae bacterium]
MEVDSGSGRVTNQWPIAGAPDVTFVNPATGLVHVAIGKPGLVQSIDPRTGGTARRWCSRTLDRGMTLFDDGTGHADGRFEALTT